MSTTIKNMAGDREVRIAPVRDFGGAMVEIGNYILGVYRADAWLPRADFLAAIEAELDVIIIDKAALDEPVYEYASGNDDAVWSAQGGHTLVVQPHRDAAWVSEHALAWLSLSRHLHAHPPVDEAQVQVLAAVMREALSTSDEPKHFVAEDAARLLLATGRIEVRDA